MAEERPTAELLDELERLWEAEWSVAHRTFETIDSFYWRTFPLWSEKYQDRPVLRPSTAANIVDHAVDNQLALKPKITVIPKNDSAEEKARAGKLGRFLGAVFEDCSLLEAALPWKMMQRYGVLYGYFVVDAPRLVLDEEPEKPERESGEQEADYEARVKMYEAARRDWNPFRIAVPHPTTVLLNPLEKHPRAGIKRAWRYVRDLEHLSLKKVQVGRAETPWFGKPEAKLGEKVETLEYFSRDWHALKVKGGELIFVERNTWGFCPFLHAFAGWGMEKASQNGSVAENLAIGILHHIRDTLTAEARSWAGMENLQMRAAFAPMGAKPGKAEEIAEQLGRGKMVEGEPDDLWILKFQEIHPWMLQLLKEFERDIEEGTYVRLLRGAREAGVVTVGQHAMQMNQAQRKFAGLQEQLNQVATIIASRILRLVEIYGETITVRGQSAGPEDINYNYAVRVRFELLDPIIQLQREQNEMAKHDRNLTSKETFWEKTGEDDLMRERKRQMKDLMWQHPALVEWGVGEVAQEEGFAEIIKDWERRQRGAGGLVGPDGRPIRSARAEPVDLRQPLGGGVAKPAPINLAALAEEE